MCPQTDGLTVPRVLVVDDEEEDRLFLRKVLERVGHEVFFARDGEEAVKAYIRQGIDLVITDLNMPNVDGFDLMSALGDFSPTPHVIVVTGLPPEDRMQASFGDPLAIMTKPIDPHELLQVIDEALSPGNG